ncbi:3-hydroxyacyl-ACP dehydratase FabZ [Minwuia thermotolerans]|uniref:3-hydroxyacyl-[acyl-carrier-protein] dehydratase FabZ n=1 Tax=Minwuia thermotolerans TaxID=2056226 RepID=A0A2M9G1H0_9PROT|nr:3-hydroxyacyl-ACP dehydratase FabZ [Minwuia thermotolerans]PJK29568.1 3-hydroxyacyl-[acyl-carrier-protein] dehydratase FabZ [Minwuia thermotolerans]
MTEAEKTAVGPVEVTRIMEMIPHRYPMLMVDRVIDIVPDVSAVGIKNVTVNEPHFTGHFPTQPVMPGVLIIEAMAQTSAVLFAQTLGTRMEGKVVYFMTIDECRFRRPVIPGDQLMIHVRKLRGRGTLIWKMKGEAYVGEHLAAEAEFAAMIQDDG